MTTPRAGIDRRSLLGLLRAPAGDAAEPSGAPTPNFVPQIKAALCEGCDICARICPRGALRLQTTEATAFYLVEANLCDGCGLCVTICDAGAVSLERGPDAARRAIPLDAGRCRACGARFHWPLARGAPEKTCRVCRARAVPPPARGEADR